MLTVCTLSSAETEDSDHQQNRLNCIHFSLKPAYCLVLAVYVSRHDHARVYLIFALQMIP